jgi:hypothetical protein
LLNSIYRFIESYVEGKSAVWFWSLKIDQRKSAIFTYGGLIIALFTVLMIFA